MASRNEEAPVCPKCGRSQGVSTEASVGLVWSRGAWRLNAQPEYTPDLFCPCGHMWSHDFD